MLLPQQPGDVGRGSQIKDIEKTQEKSAAATVGIWIQSFFKAFFIPVGIMSLDVLFDVFPVREYSDMDPKCLTALWNACYSTSNGTSFGTSCGSNSTELVPMGNGKSFFCLPKDQCTIGPSENIVPPEGLNIFCIPLKLDAQPRFLYSLGFIIWPWVYYFMEFLQSDDFKNMHKVCVFFSVFSQSVC